MAANVSQGAYIQKTISSAFVTIGDVTGISISGISRAEIDVTALADTSKKYLMGTIDSGTIEVQLNYDDDDTVGANALQPGGANGTTVETASVAWKIVVPCGYNGSGTAQTQPITFNAFQQAFSVEAAVDSQLTASLTLRIDGAVTFGSCAPA
jgi:hypothetical protein